MNGLAGRWARAMYAPSGGHRTAAFRVALAIYLLIYFGTMAPHVTLLFSDQGVYVPYLLPDLAPPPPVAGVLFAAMMLATFAILIGYRANLSAVCLLILFSHHYFLQLAVKQSSFDRLLLIYLLILCFADAGAAWSPTVRSNRTAAATVWPERLIAFQTVTIYLGAGLWKAVNPSWHGGEMLWFTLQGMFATEVGFALTRLGLPEAAWTAATALIVVAELAIGVGLLIRRTRPLAMVSGVIFHLANCVILAVPEFLLMLPAYAMFIEPETLQRWGTRARALRSL